MVIGVSPDSTVAWVAGTGLKLPAFFSLVK